MNFQKSLMIGFSVILLGGFGFSLHYRQRLAAAHALQRELAAKMAGFGLRVDTVNPAQSLRTSQTQRSLREADQHGSIAEMSILIREITEGLESGDMSRSLVADKIKTFKGRLKLLNSMQWKSLFAEIGNNHKFLDCLDGDRIHESTLAAMMTHFIDSNEPEKACALATEFPGMFKPDEKCSWPLNELVIAWSKNDPLAVARWVLDNQKKFPDLIRDYSVTNVMLGNLAGKDPNLAFKLISDLGVKNIDWTMSTMIYDVDSFESRTKFLGLLKNYVLSIPAEENRDRILGKGISLLVRTALAQDSETAYDWIKKANISPEEFVTVVDNIAEDSYGVPKNTEGIDWLIQQLPPEQVDESVSNVVKSWVKLDYKRTGEWVSRISNGPKKDAAVYSYCHEVAAYEPEVAVKWAMILPPGEGRNRALHGIHENWLKTDPQGRDNFGTLHGFSQSAVLHPGFEIDL